MIPALQHFQNDFDENKPCFEFIGEKVKQNFENRSFLNLKIAPALAAAESNNENDLLVWTWLLSLILMLGVFACAVNMSREWNN